MLNTLCNRRWRYAGKTQPDTCSIRPAVLPGLLSTSGRPAYHHALVVCGLYNFTDAAEPKVEGRRDRGHMKKESRQLLAITKGLTSMSDKQLGAVAHLLPPGTAEAVKIAARLPRSNQGRKRQEGLVVKMLRVELTDSQISKLLDAVQVATKYQGVYQDRDVDSIIDEWKEGLLANDEDIVSEVYGYPLDWAPDHQNLRTVVRQLQEALAAEEQQQQQQQAEDAASAAAATSGSDSGSGSDSELAAIAAAAAGKRGKGKGKKAEPASRSLSRQLGRLLKPLALRVVQEQERDVE